MIKWFKRWFKKKLQKYHILEQRHFEQWLLDMMQQQAIAAINKKKTEFYSRGSSMGVALCNELEKDIYLTTQEFKTKAIQRYKEDPQL